MVKVRKTPPAGGISAKGEAEAITMASGETEPMYSAVPSEEAAVPPMPKMPRTVRLPSGEVVELSSNGSAGNSFGSSASAGAGAGASKAGKGRSEKNAEKKLEKGMLMYAR